MGSGDLDSTGTQVEAVTARVGINSTFLQDLVGTTQTSQLNVTVSTFGTTNLLSIYKQEDHTSI